MERFDAARRQDDDSFEPISEENRRISAFSAGPLGMAQPWRSRRIQRMPETLKPSQWDKVLLSFASHFYFEES